MHLILRPKLTASALRAMTYLTQLSRLRLDLEFKVEDDFTEWAEVADFLANLRELSGFIGEPRLSDQDQNCVPLQISSVHIPQCSCTSAFCLTNLQGLRSSELVMLSNQHLQTRDP